MKKFLVLLCCGFLSLSVLANGRGCPLPYGPGGRPGPYRPCPPPHHGHDYHGGSDGVRLAADIVGLVGASVFTTGAIVNATTPKETVVVQQQPVVVQQPASTSTVVKEVYIYPDGTRKEVYR